MNKLLLVKGGIKAPSCLIPLLVVLAGVIYGIYHIFTYDSVGTGIVQGDEGTGSTDTYRQNMAERCRMYEV